MAKSVDASSDTVVFVVYLVVIVLCVLYMLEGADMINIVDAFPR